MTDQERPRGIPASTDLRQWNLPLLRHGPFNSLILHRWQNSIVVFTMADRVTLCVVITLSLIIQLSMHYTLG